MQGLILGVVVGLYTGNPAIKRQIDGMIKKVAGYGIDALNGNNPQHHTGGVSGDEASSGELEE